MVVEKSHIITNTFSMTKNLMLITTFLVLGLGFWLLPELKEVAAGIALLLLGMTWMQEEFNTFTGGVLERFLQSAIGNTPKSILFGATVTTLMQSSSLVSLISISFISAGLITLAQGIGIIFGANIGTTTGAWLVASVGLKVDIAAYAMPMLVFGVILKFQKGSKLLPAIGTIISGISFLFLGIAFMKSGFQVLSSEIDLRQFAICGTKGLLIFTGIGILATVVMQSSHATLMLTIAALAGGQVEYYNALALAIGSNIGTTITATLGAMGSNPAGKQLAGAHLIFNTTTGLVALLMIEPLANLVNWISAHLGIANNDFTLKLATFHTLFNVIGVAIMLPFIGHMTKFLANAVKVPEPTKKTVEPLYLNKSALLLPDTALEVIRQEVRHLAENAFEILAHGLSLHRSDILSTSSMSEIVASSNMDMSVRIRNLYRHKVKPLFSAILEFSATAERNMLPEQIKAMSQMRFACKRIVDAIKYMKELQRNVAIAPHSENPYVQHEYNRIRRYLGKLLRAIFTLDVKDKLDDLDNQFKQFQDQVNTLKIEAEKNDVVANGNLDKLIRENLISPDMATSLMNDSDYAWQISKALIDAVESIHGGLQYLQAQTSLVEPAEELIRSSAEASSKDQLEAEHAEIDSIKEY